jgi:hypothetical protein
MQKKVVKTFTLNHKFEFDEAKNIDNTTIYFNTNILNLDADEVIIKNISFFNTSNSMENTGIYTVHTNIDNTTFSFCPNLNYDNTLDLYILTLSQTLDLSILLTSHLNNNLIFKLKKMTVDGISEVTNGYFGMTLQFIKFHK